MIARQLASAPTARTLRFVAFVNEEPPHFRTGDMGSRRYAAMVRERGDRVVGMVSLETMGFFTDEPGSQRYPFPGDFFYPSKGNYIAIVGDMESRSLVTQVVRGFRESVAFPSEGGAWPRTTPGVGLSDHESFWFINVPAVMITDTAPFRYRHYHAKTDTVDKVDLTRLALVVQGLVGATRALGNGQ